jgi:hypothetical protein
LVKICSLLHSKITFCNRSKYKSLSAVLPTTITMMLSPQAARMSCVSTSLGHIRRSTRFLSIGRRHFDPSIRSRFRLSSDTSRAFSVSAGLSRFKSTMAAYDESEDGDNIDYRHKGHVAAAKARASDASKSHDEAWMINLGRDGDNEWLTGPRDQEWFTGVAPRECPGTYNTIIAYYIWHDWG